MKVGNMDYPPSGARPMRPPPHPGQPLRTFVHKSARSLLQHVRKIGPGRKDLRNANPKTIRSMRRVHRDFESVKPLPSNLVQQDYGWVITPKAAWKVKWDLWIGLIIVYTIILVPYRIGFAIELEQWEQILNYLFDASFGLDMVLTFFTGFYDDDVFVYQYGKIARRYFQSWFFVDLVSCLPLDSLIEAASTGNSSLLSFKLFRTVRLFRLLKLIRVLRLKRTFQTVQMNALNAHVLQTMRSLMVIIFIIHLVSCGWYMFYTWDTTGSNWVTGNYPDGLKHTYLVSFYWVANTMMSVGYGDITAVTDGERIYSIFVECLGSVCVGLIIANIQMLTDNLNPRGAEMNNKVQETKEFLSKSNIPRRMRQRIISQFEYHWNRRSVFDEDELLDKFPMSLQYEILASSMDSFVHTFPFFGATSVDFFIEVIPKLRPILLGPTQNLVDAESVWEEIYFICNGTVDALRGNLVVGSLTTGDICGIEYLVTDRKRYLHTYRSVSKTELYAIHSVDMIEALPKCEVAEHYLRDLSIILHDRYTESASRPRKPLVRQEGSLRSSKRKSQRGPELYAQYRHRKSYSAKHTLEQIHPFTASRINEEEDGPHWSIIRHYSKWRIAWDVFIGIQVAFIALSVPFRISFDLADTMHLIVLDRTADCCFLFDILISFFTSYVDETGVEVLNVVDIRKHYLKTTFLLDVISTIPFDVIVDSVASSEHLRSLMLFRTIKLIKLLRLMRISKLFKVAAQWASEFDVNTDTIRLLKILLPTFVIAHYVGCFWHYIAIDSLDDGWLKHSTPPLTEQNSTATRYIASLYWAATTMTTVGFGDIVAINIYEQVYSTIVMIGGTTVFAYVVGTVIEVVSNSKSLTNRERNMGQRVNEYIKERGVSSEFIKACHEHLRFLNGEKTLFNEKQLFDSLSHSLRSELILYLNNGILSNTRFFEKKPKWFLSLILPRMQPQYFLPGDLLIYNGNLVSGIFFLIHGVVIAKEPVKDEVTLPSTASSYSSLGRRHANASQKVGATTRIYQGEFFGHNESFDNEIAKYNVFALKASGTYLLPRKFLEHIKLYFPEVMTEVSALILKSVQKQQTKVQRDQNNNAVSILGQRSDTFGKTSGGNADESEYLHDNCSANQSGQNDVVEMSVGSPRDDSTVGRASVSSTKDGPARSILDGLAARAQEDKSEAHSKDEVEHELHIKSVPRTRRRSSHRVAVNDLSVMDLSSDEDKKRRQQLLRSVIPMAPRQSVDHRRIDDIVDRLLSGDGYISPREDPSEPPSTP